MLLLLPDNAFKQSSTIVATMLSKSAYIIPILLSQKIIAYKHNTYTHTQTHLIVLLYRIAGNFRGKTISQLCKARKINLTKYLPQLIIFYKANIRSQFLSHSHSISTASIFKLSFAYQHFSNHSSPHFSIQLCGSLKYNSIPKTPPWQLLSPHVLPDFDFTCTSFPLLRHGHPSRCVKADHGRITMYKDVVKFYTKYLLSYIGCRSLGKKNKTQKNFNKGFPNSQHVQGTH